MTNQQNSINYTNNYNAKDMLNIQPDKVYRHYFGNESFNKKETFVRCMRPELHTNGDKNPSLRINTEKWVHYCDVCELSGNAYDLVSLKENLSEPKDIYGKVEEIYGIKSDSKIQLRLISNSNENRFTHKFSNECSFKTTTQEDLQNIIENLGKKYSLSTFLELKKFVKISQYPYAIAFMKNDNFLFNPNKKTSFIVVEGRTDFLTAVEMGFDREFGIYSRFNKACKFQLTGGEYYFLLDSDDSEEEMRNRLEVKKKSSICFGKPPTEFKDLSEWFNKGLCTDRNVIDTFKSETLEEVSPKLKKDKFYRISLSKKYSSGKQKIDFWNELEITNEVVNLLKGKTPIPPNWAIIPLLIKIGALTRGKAGTSIRGNKTKPNFYYTLLASSGTGKTESLRIVNQLTNKLDEQMQMDSKIKKEKFIAKLESEEKQFDATRFVDTVDYNLPMSTSFERLMRILSQRGFGLAFVTTELETFLRTLSKGSDGKLKPLFTSFFDGETERVSYQNSGDIEVKNPFVSLVAPSTKEAFTSNLSAVDSDSGFLQRFLFEVATKEEENQIKLQRAVNDDFAQNKPFNSKLIDDFLLKVYSYFSDDNKILFEPSDEAKEMWRKYKIDCYTANKSIDDKKNSFYTRIETNAMKFAILLQLIENFSDDGRENDNILTPTNLNRGILLAEYFKSNLGLIFDEFCKKTGDKNQRKILSNLENNGQRNSKELQEATKIPAIEIDKAIKELVELNQIEEVR